MARYGGIELCKVSGDVSIDGEVRGAGTIKLHKGGMLGGLSLYDCYLKVVTTSTETTFLFDENDSSITATDNSITFSEMRSVYPLYSSHQIVHLKGAEQSQIQRFLVKLPASIKEKYLREPTTANQETRTRKSKKEKANLHEEPTREAQQLTGRQEQLQQQKQLGEARLREQLREKENQKQNLERRLRSMQLQRKREKGEQQENSQTQLREMERQLRRKDEQQQNLQTQLREMKKQLHKNEEQETKLRGQLMEKEQQLIILQSDKEKECAYMQQKLSVKLKELSDLQKELRDKEQDIVDIQKDFSAAKEKVIKYESQLRTRDWVLSRDEIQLTKTLLGDGSYARVVEGRYCGSPVAIKILHRTSFSRQELSSMEREMDIASRCRHPCLLQFIGATQDEKSPWFVTELMETSLRELLGKQQLSETEVSVISLDVARALNYLHQRKPKPIVHRDVSSANVLLWKQNDQWRGKLSDYGTVKFLQEMMTKGPGALSYSAPEVGSPYNQTVKIDVYSFGVLFCEMCTAKLPVIENREAQVKLVTNKDFQVLIMWCIEEDPEMRPSMEEVIEKLEPAV